MNNFDARFRKRNRRYKRLQATGCLIFLPLEPRQLLAGDLFLSGASLPGTMTSVLQTQVQMDSDPICAKDHDHKGNPECENVDQTLDGTIVLRDFTFDGDINTFNFYSTGNLNAHPGTTNSRAVVNEDNSSPGSPPPLPHAEPENRRRSELNQLSRQPWQVENSDSSRVHSADSNTHTPPSKANPLETSLIAFPSGSEWNPRETSVQLEIQHHEYFSTTQSSDHGILAFSQRTGVIDHFQTFSILDIEPVDSPTSLTSTDMKGEEFDSTLAMQLLAKIERVDLPPINQSTPENVKRPLPIANEGERQLVHAPPERTAESEFVSLAAWEISPRQQPPQSSPTPDQATVPLSEGDIAARLDTESNDLGNPIPLIETAAIAAFLVANFPHANEEQDAKNKAYPKHW